MTDGHEDRGPMDPTVNAPRWERAVSSIVAAAGPELARRARARGTFAVLDDWARPVFAIAASLVLLASAALLTGGGDGGELAAAEFEGNTVAEALVGPELAAWLEVGHTLTADELATAIDEH